MPRASVAPGSTGISRTTHQQSATEPRHEIQQICLNSRCYGYRRVTAALRAQGRIVNRKRVLRLMRSDNLLCLRKRRFVCTTDSRHSYAVYPNLTRLRR